MIEPGRFRPGGFRVAVFADFALLAAMYFVIEVTRGAGRAGFRFGDGLDMALLAFRLGVFAAQEEAGVEAVVEFRLRPALVAVALAAVGAIVAFVMVVFEVAAGAGHVELVAERVFAMTGRALGQCMLAQQREVGVTLVVEARIRP